MRTVRTLLIACASMLILAQCGWSLGFVNFTGASIAHLSDSTFQLRASFAHGGEYIVPGTGQTIYATLQGMKIWAPDYNYGSAIDGSWNNMRFNGQPFPLWYNNGFEWYGGHQTGTAESWMIPGGLEPEFGWDFYAKSFDRHWVEFRYVAMLEFTDFDGQNYPEIISGGTYEFAGSFRVELPTPYAVPEPATVLLFSLGCLGLGSIVPRKRL